jgi:hypothetical protein
MTVTPDRHGDQGWALSASLSAIRASRTEARLALAGDELVRDRYRTTHAVSIDRPAAEVWPWLVQMGYGRGGWYSYDRLERAIGAGDFCDGGNASRIIPELQSLTLGDTVALSEAGGMTVAVLEPDHALVLRFRMDLLRATPATARSRAVLDWTWSFNLLPAAAGCRLVIRVRADPSPTALRLLLPLLTPVHFLMERKMLLTIRERAESHPAAAMEALAIPRGARR